MIAFWYGLKTTWYGLKDMVTNFGRPQFSVDNLFPAALLILFIVMLSQSFDWAFAARIVPTIVGIGAILFCSLSLVNDVFGVHERGAAAAGAGAGAGAGGKEPKKIHMDIVSKTSHLPGATVITRGFLFFGWMAGFMVLMWVIGLIPAVPIFIISYMRVEGREKWKIVIPMAAAVVVLIYVVFDQLLAIPWPPTLAGHVISGAQGDPQRVIAAIRQFCHKPRTNRDRFALNSKPNHAKSCDELDRSAIGSRSSPSNRPTRAIRAP